MAKVRYKKVLEEIWARNERMFQQFLILNNDYSDPSKRANMEDEFQKIGEKVKKILQVGENNLCRQMEKSSHRMFSSKLADKYWDEVRKYFKYIDQVGVVTKRV
jgi:hypothetical protein